VSISNPDFKLQYFLAVMTFSLLFFCFSLMGVVSSSVGLLLPQNNMFPFQDGYLVCNGYNSSFGGNNQPQPNRSMQEIAECMQETDKRNKIAQEAGAKTGIITSSFAMLLTGIIWFVHFKLYQKHQKYNKNL
jgi:hypothetical protein